MGFLVLDRTPHGLEEMKSILNGNILWITARDVSPLVHSIWSGGSLPPHFSRQVIQALLRREGQFVVGVPVLPQLCHCIGQFRIDGQIVQVFSFLVIPVHPLGRLYQENVIGTGYWLVTGSCSEHSWHSAFLLVRSADCTTDRCSIKLPVFCHTGDQSNVQSVRSNR